MCIYIYILYYTHTHTHVYKEKGIETGLPGWEPGILPHSLVVRIPDCHPGGPVSFPCVGNAFLYLTKY